MILGKTHASSPRETDEDGVLQDFSKITPSHLSSPKSKVAKCLEGGAETSLLPPPALLLLKHPHSWAGVSTFTPSHHAIITERCSRGLYK